MAQITATNEYTRFMVEMFSELNSVLAPTAFQGSFFGVAQNGAKTVFSSNSKSIEIDIVRRNGRRLAQMVHRGTNSENDTRGKKITASKFSNEARVWPLIETEGFISSGELLDRVAGENPYGEMSREDRLSDKALEIHVEHMTNHIHTMEYLARESILTGTHPAILGTSKTDYMYDFFRNPANLITVGNAWNSGSQDIYGDMDNACDKIQQNAYLFGEYGQLTGTGAFAALKADATIAADADNRRYGFVELSRDIPVPSAFSRYVENGFQPRGWVDTPKGRKIWIFTYDVTFTDDFTDPENEAEVPWMPEDKAVVFSPKARCDRYFGPADRLPVTAQEVSWYQETFGFNMMTPPMPANIQNSSAIDPRMFHCDAYLGSGKKSLAIRTQSAAILPTTQTDAFATLSGLVE